LIPITVLRGGDGGNVISLPGEGGEPGRAGTSLCPYPTRGHPRERTYCYKPGPKSWMATWRAYFAAGTRSFVLCRALPRPVDALLILPLHNARSFMRVGVFFNLGNLPVAAVVDPAILIIVLLACASLGGNAVLDHRRIPIGQDAVDVEPKGLHVEHPLGRRAPQLPGDGFAAFHHCKRGALWRVPFHIFGKQRGEFVPVTGRQGFIIRFDQRTRLFGLHEQSSLGCELSLPDQYPTQRLLQALSGLVFSPQ